MTLPDEQSGPTRAKTTAPAFYPPAASLPNQSFPDELSSTPINKLIADFRRIQPNKPGMKNLAS